MDEIDGRVRLDDRGLPLHRTPQVIVKRYGTGKLERHIEKSVTDSLNFLEQVRPFPRTARLIGQDLEALHAVLAAQHLDERVGVGDGGRLVANHDQDVMRRLR